MKRIFVGLALALMFCGQAMGQEAPRPPEQPGQPPMMGRPDRRPPGMGFRGPGEWWKDPELVRKIGVSDDQIQRIEKISQDHHIQNIDLRAALEKQEAILQPLMEADHPDESQVMAQIDRVAEARANLEKSNIRMLLATRQVLTAEQWKKLRESRGMPPFPGGRGAGPEGRGPEPGPGSRGPEKE